jgi:protoporphyrinogen oxidase
MYMTKISIVNFTELLSPANGVAGKTGIQVEVYFSKYKPFDKSAEEIKANVEKELVTMGLINSSEAIESSHTHFVEWANVIFDTDRIESLATILDWLTTVGLVREVDEQPPGMKIIERN